jgi:hypothetical protein
MLVITLICLANYRRFPQMPLAASAVYPVTATAVIAPGFVIQKPTLKNIDAIISPNKPEPSPAKRAFHAPLRLTITHVDGSFTQSVDPSGFLPPSICSHDSYSHGVLTLTKLNIIANINAVQIKKGIKAHVTKFTGFRFCPSDDAYSIMLYMWQKIKTNSIIEFGN